MTFATSTTNIETIEQHVLVPLRGRASCESRVSHGRPVCLPKEAAPIRGAIGATRGRSDYRYPPSPSHRYRRNALASWFIVSLFLALAVDSSCYSQDKAPVPDEASQQRAANLINEAFAEEFERARSPADNLDLATRLLAEAVATEDDLAGRYMLLKIACDLSSQHGELETALHAIEQMASDFDVDNWSLILASVDTALANSQSSSILRSNLITVGDVVTKAIAIDHYDAAQRLTVAASTRADRSRDAHARKLIRDLNTEVSEMQRLYDFIRDDLDVLVMSPNDPRANLNVGRYMCFAKGEWQSGLPLIAKGNDAELRQAAELELAESSDAIVIADAWWPIGAIRTGIVKTNIIFHAASWYEKALPDTSGLTRARAQSRIKEAAGLRREPVAPEEEVHSRRHYFAIEDADIRFLDWKNRSWANDIRSRFQVENLADKEFRIRNNIGGFEHKLILFPRENVASKKMVIEFTVEYGSFAIHLRPRNLAPMGAIADVEVKWGERTTVELWIDKKMAKCTVNGRPGAVEQRPECFGYFALAPGNNSSVVIHDLQFVDK